MGTLCILNTPLLQILMSVVRVKIPVTITLPVQTPMGALSVNATLASMGLVSTAQVHGRPVFTLSSDLQFNLLETCIDGLVGLVSSPGVASTLGGQLRTGRVEVCHNHSMGRVCHDDQWGEEDAAVVCHQLGFSPYGQS